MIKVKYIFHKYRDYNNIDSGQKLACQTQFDCQDH